MPRINEYSTSEEKNAFFSRHPSKLYKYRCWSDEYHRKVLSENELFYSSPKRFNDPYDCGLPFRQHPENSNPVLIKHMVEKVVLMQNPDLINYPIRLQDVCAKQVLLISQDPEGWFGNNWGYTPEKLGNLFGVLSLTPHPDNYLMWSHYSNSHQGFCVEFDTRKLVESIDGTFMKVSYSNEIPIISIRESFQDELLDKLIYTKSNVWNYEDEYRFTSIKCPNTTVKFNPEALTAVYFECRTSFEDKMEIIKIVSQKFSCAKFFKMELCKENFRLLKTELPIL